MLFPPSLLRSELRRAQRGNDIGFVDNFSPV